MDKVKTMLKSVWFASLVRQMLSGIAALLAGHGINVGSYVEPLCSLVIVIAVVVWSNYSHKHGKKIVVVKKEIVK